MSFSFSLLLSWFVLFVFIGSINFLSFRKDLLKTLTTYVIYWLGYLETFFARVMYYNLSSVLHNLLFLLILVKQPGISKLILSRFSIILLVPQLVLLLGGKHVYLTYYWVVLKYAEQTGLAVSLYYWIMLIHALFFYVLALATFLFLLSSTSAWFYFKLTLLCFRNKTSTLLNSTLFNL